jgi:hypothetical protein
VLAVFGFDADRLAVIFDRAVVALGVEMNRTAVDVTARFAGAELDRRAVVVERGLILFSSADKRWPRLK